MLRHKCKSHKKASAKPSSTHGPKPKPQPHHNTAAHVMTQTRPHPSVRPQQYHPRLDFMRLNSSLGQYSLPLGEGGVVQHYASHRHLSTEKTTQEQALPQNTGDPNVNAPSMFCSKILFPPFFFLLFCSKLPLISPTFHY